MLPKGKEAALLVEDFDCVWPFSQGQCQCWHKSLFNGVIGICSQGFKRIYFGHVFIFMEVN